MPILGLGFRVFGCRFQNLERVFRARFQISKKVFRARFFIFLPQNGKNSHQNHVFSSKFRSKFNFSSLEIQKISFLKVNQNGSNQAQGVRKTVEEKFGEQNFRVLSEMRILAKIASKFMIFIKKIVPKSIFLLPKFKNFALG